MMMVVVMVMMCGCAKSWGDQNREQQGSENELFHKQNVA